MRTKKVYRVSSLACAALMALMAGCTGHSIEGEYVCKESLLDVIKLESGGKAYVSATMFGMRSEKAGTYTLDGDRVNVVINGESTVLTLSGKTLDGGGLVGKCTAR